MSNKEIKVQIGPGLPGLLTVLFVGLKLTGYISWSWWWVLSPIWIPLAIVLGILAAFLLVVGIIAGIGALLKR